MSEVIYDLVKVVNHGHADVTLRGNTVYVIPAQGSRIIPFDVAASWFGDPRITNEGRERMRENVFRQVQFQWGYVEGNPYPVDPYDMTKGLHTWETFKPTVECFDANTDERIYFVLDDPEGELVGEFKGQALIDPNVLDKQALQRQVDDLSKKLSQLLAVMADREVQAPIETNSVVSESFDGAVLPTPDPTEDESTEDAPRTVKAGSRSK